MSSRNDLLSIANSFFCLVIAVDIFEKANFTGAKLPRFDKIKGDYPRDLESSVLFPDTLLRASERKGRMLLLTAFETIIRV